MQYFDYTLEDIKCCKQRHDFLLFYFTRSYTGQTSWNSLVSEIIGFRLDDRGSIPSRVRNSRFHYVHSVFHAMGIRDLSPRMKFQERQADHPSLSTTEFWMRGAFISIYSYIFMAKHRDNFAFNIVI
jgi:hypothetical protein